MLFLTADSSLIHAVFVIMIFDIPWKDFLYLLIKSQKMKIVYQMLLD